MHARNCDNMNVRGHLVQIKYSKKPQFRPLKLGGRDRLVEVYCLLVLYKLFDSNCVGKIFELFVPGGVEYRVLISNICSTMLAQICLFAIIMREINSNK